MRRPVCSLLLLAILVVARGPSAAGEDACGWVDLEGARVFASPGLPEAFLPHLPGGGRPDGIPWPLPPGPVLVLGLPDADPAAEAVGEAFGLLPADGDLHGGWTACAWRDGRRPIGVILASDPVALLDARFELDSASTGRATMPETRVTGGTPEEGNALRMPAGCRRHRPRFARRILHADPDMGIEDAVLTALGSHATGVLFEEAHPDAPGYAGAVAMLSRHGVRTLFSEDLAGFQRGPPGDLVDSSPGQPYGIRFGVSDPSSPRLHVETWNEAWRGEDAIPRVPSAPRNHEPDLGEKVEGTIVRQGRGASEALDHAWTQPDDPAPEEAWRTHLLPLLPRGVRSARVFLVRSGEALFAQAERSHDALPWQRALATHLAVEASRLRPPVLQVPLVPGPIHDDGSLSEPAWAFAASRELTLRVGDETVPARLLALADGHGVVVALRAREPLTRVDLSLADERGIALVTCTMHEIAAWNTEPRWDVDAYPTRVFHLTLVPWIDETEGRAIEETLVLVP